MSVRVEHFLVSGYSLKGALKTAFDQLIRSVVMIVQNFVNASSKGMAC